MNAPLEALVRLTVPFAGWLTIAKVSAAPLGPLAESVPETAVFSLVVTEPLLAVGAATPPPPPVGVTMFAIRFVATGVPHPVG